MELLGLAERAAVGALLIVALGIVSDRLRPYYGALLASIPTTTAVSLLYIARDHGPTFAAEAASSSLATQVANLAFVVVFAALAYAVAPARRAWVALAGVGTYFVVALSYLAAMHGRDASMGVNLAVYLGALGLALAARHALRRRPAKEHGFGRHALKAGHATRAALGAGFVVVASILAERLGPHWGGVFASFPATFMSLLIVAYPNRSLPYFMEQALGIVPSTLNLAAYIVAVHFAFPRWGPWWGTLVAYAAFAAVANPMAIVNLRSLRKTDEALSDDALLQAATEEPQ